VQYKVETNGLSRFGNEICKMTNRMTVVELSGGPSTPDTTTAGPTAAPTYYADPTPLFYSSGQGDPHLTFAHGGRADFRGKHNAYYNVLSAHHAAINIMIKNATIWFRRGTAILHGSFITEAHAVLLVRPSKREPDRRRFFNISFVFSDGAVAEARAIPETGGHVIASGFCDEEEFVIGPGNTQVCHGATADAGRNFVFIENGRWKIAFAFGKRRKNADRPHERPVKMYHVDFEFWPKVEEWRLGVWPHGLIGQSYDGDKIAVDGKTDDYQVRKGRGRYPEYTTSALAEGAIEGTADDYQVAGPYAVDFKFSRFFATESTGPRNLSKLSGRQWYNKKVQALPRAGGMSDRGPSNKGWKSHYDEPRRASGRWRGGGINITALLEEGDKEVSSTLKWKPYTPRERKCAEEINRWFWEEGDQPGQPEPKLKWCDY